ncbi:MAG: hypothetical protein KDA28_10925 [Phycisphaerales bacterium]|nr:hypothetical protein [Phycisphaerales bacterium]
MTEPIRLVTSEAPGLSNLDRGLLFFGAATALVVLVACVLLLRRHLRPSDPGERAFRSMARRLGIGRGGAALVRRLASHVEVAPPALLVSRHALLQAVRSSPGIEQDPAYRRLYERLLH